jgi:hypothetical protein
MHSSWTRYASLSMSLCVWDGSLVGEYMPDDPEGLFSASDDADGGLVLAYVRTSPRLAQLSDALPDRRLSLPQLSLP